MRHLPDEKPVYLADESESENKQSYNTFERLLFLIIIFIITVLSLVFAVPIFVFAKAKDLLIPVLSVGGKSALSSKEINTYKEIFRVILAVSIVVVGVLHFAVAEPFIKIVPPYLPYHRLLVYVSGFFEILGGIGLLIPSVSRAAAWGLIALFIAVFPANINMAVNHIHIDGVPDSPLFQWVRLPSQAILIAWAWWYTKPSDRDKEANMSQTN